MNKYGAVNAHLVGIAMKEMVRRVIAAIRHERFIFEAHIKQAYDGEMDDVVTTADKAAQTIYVKLITEMFPTFGIVAEEGELSLPCTAGPEVGEIYFTVDPLDGTKAFKRRQSHGIGTMIALVQHGKIIAVCIGDVMTQEIYYYRPESSHVHRVSEFQIAEELIFPSDRILSEQYISLRERPEKYPSSLIQRLLRPSEAGGAFKDLEVAGSSIGIGMARLWKGEVGAVLLHAGHETPWDSTPVFGICQKLGFVFLEPNDIGWRFEVTDLRVAKDIVYSPHDRLVIHKSLLPQLEVWLQAAMPR